MPAPYLLDTTVLLHWTCNSPQAQAIDANVQRSSSAMRPLVCEVSLGEMLAFSLSRSWRAQKLRRLDQNSASWNRLTQWLRAVSGLSGTNDYQTVRIGYSPIGSSLVMRTSPSAFA
jgi:hypothetical protein